MHGDLRILWQPIEYVIIMGGALGAFLAGNPKSVTISAFKCFPTLVKGPKYKKDAYIELLSCLFTIFRIAKSKGDLALVQHVEKPSESSLFANFPKLQNDHHAVDFLCDYLRLLTLGASNPHEISDVMDEELEVHHHDKLMVSGAIRTIGEAIPALGIVAAVLGVIVTMSSIAEPPEVLGWIDWRGFGRYVFGYFYCIWLCRPGGIQPRIDLQFGTSLFSVHKGWAHGPHARLCAAGFGRVRT